MKENPAPSGIKVPSRRRFFFCTLATILFVAGTLILLGTIALFVIFRVSTRALPNSETYRQRTLYQQTDANQWDYDFQPLTIIVILASVGGALIIFASICAVISCTVHDGSSSGSRAEHTDSEEEERKDEQLVTPLIGSGNESEVMSPQTSHKQQATHETPKGDINTIGLPETVPGTIYKVPRNGFTYLANPGEIHSYYRNKASELNTSTIESKPRLRLESAI